MAERERGDPNSLGDPSGAQRNQSGSGGLDSRAEAVLHGRDEDVELMLAFRAGNAVAFDTLFERWSGRLLRYLERVVRDTGTAEELVQEAFLRVYRARERYVPKARFSTWLYRIATNLALNELRRPRRRDPHRSTDDVNAPELVSEAATTDEIVHARRMGSALETALGALPERQRAALVLSAVDGLSYSEIATTLAVTEKAVKALVHRARAALAEKIREPRREETPGVASRRESSKVGSH